VIVNGELVVDNAKPHCRGGVVPLSSNQHIGMDAGAVPILLRLLPWRTHSERRQANEFSLVFDFERRSDQHRCVEPSPGRLFDHPVDQRLLSGLEQLNALEAIPQRLQNRAQDVQNIWRRDGREETANRST
jgi:hypothetical protein